MLRNLWDCLFIDSPCRGRPAGAETMPSQAFSLSPRLKCFRSKENRNMHFSNDFKLLSGGIGAACDREFIVCKSAPTILKSLRMRCHCCVYGDCATMQECN